MNNDTSKKAPVTKNPWSESNNIPALRAWRTILFSVLVLACSVYPQISHYKHSPYIACAIGVLTAITFYNAIPGRLLLIIPAAIIAIGIGSFSLAADMLAMVLAVALGAILISVCAKKHPRLAPILIILPAASFAIAYLLSKSISLSLLSVALYPAMILLAFASVNDSSRVSAICHASFGFAIAGITIVGVIVFRKYGAFNPDTLREAIADANTYLVRLTHNFFIENEEFLKPLYDAAELSSYTDFISVEVLISSLFSYVPAIFIILCNALGFFAQSGFVNVIDKLYGNEPKKLATAKSRKFLMSAPAAVIFIVAGIAQFIASCAGADAFAIICETVTIVLIPGFCLSGLGTFLASLVMSKSKNKPVMIILLCLFASCMFYAAVALLAIHGALNTISYHLIRNKVNHLGDHK